VPPFVLVDSRSKAAVNLWVLMDDDTVAIDWRDCPRSEIVITYSTSTSSYTLGILDPGCSLTVTRRTEYLRTGRYEWTFVSFRPGRTVKRSGHLAPGISYEPYLILASPCFGHTAVTDLEKPVRFPGINHQPAHIYEMPGSRGFFTNRVCLIEKGPHISSKLCLP
jgi:hypothetical protein